MDIKFIVLARKYAQAYLNLFIDQISEREYQKLQMFSDFIESHRQTMFFLGLKSIPADAKEKIISELIDAYSLPSSLKKLLHILIEHGRAELIGLTLSNICEQYRKKNRIMLFNIQSSYPLNSNQLSTMNHFLEQTTGWTILSKNEINKNLIAGIRLQSDTYLWEYSVRKQINQLIQKGCR